LYPSFTAKNKAILLENKNAIIYGAGGSLGSPVAKALALAGARVFLTGRNLNPLQQVTQDIVASGGTAQVDQVDALDEEAVQTHLQKVVDQASTVDISFNAIDL
jgi:NADP-dependent 3-hydroxy acid dehydrogenase YdfG